MGQTRHRGTLVLVLTLGLVAGHVLAGEGDPVDERLIVFTQPGVSELANKFHADQLPAIRRLAAKMDLPVVVIDATKGSPEEIKITPLVVYQNYRGRSIYQGRYTNVERIRTFIRTSRAVPQGKETRISEHVAVRRLGRATIVAPLKIAGVTGTLPDEYDHEQFVEDTRNAIFRGFSAFAPARRVEICRADRMFYMDFYPWLSEDNTLYLSLALFSQFHCKKPIYTSEGKALTGPWKERDRLYGMAAAQLERAVEQQIAASPIGDGLDVVPISTPVVTWESLGLALPPAPRGKTPGVADAPSLVRNWVVAKPDDSAPPLIQFSFPAPLDMYAGEVTRVTGRITLGENLRLGTAKGFVEADPSSVTMGEPDLDDALRASLFLDVSNHPSSRFILKSVYAEATPLTFGTVTPATLEGTLELKGVRVPLSVAATFEPVVNGQGTPQLLMNGSFSIDLRDFGIEGADGPAPANHMLLIEINMALAPTRDR